MKYFYIVFNILLVVLISVALFLKPSKDVLTASIASKSLMTSSFNNSEVQLRVNNDANVVAEDVVSNDENSNTVSTSENGDTSNVVAESTPNNSDIVPVSSEGGDVLESQVGSLAAYGPDCSGCSGRLAGGFDARGGNYIYHDDVYGDIRVLAGDSKYAFGTIVRVSNTSLGTFNAIVLDRGGGVGFNKRFLFDLLCSSNAAAMQVGSFHNVSFEILRYGY